MNATVASVAGETPYLLRLPPELKAELENLAKENHRSLNGEIIHALVQYVKRERNTR